MRERVCEGGCEGEKCVCGERNYSAKDAAAAVTTLGSKFLFSNDNEIHRQLIDVGFPGCWGLQ